LIDARHKNNVRAYRGANADSDHYLVIIRIKAKSSRSKYVLKRDFRNGWFDQECEEE
jgi:hypothetical protein